MTMCLLWENLSCTRSKRLNDSRNKNQLDFVLMVAQFASFHKQTYQAIVQTRLSHLTRVVEGTTRTTLLSNRRTSHVWCAGLQKSEGLADNDIMSAWFFAS